MDVAGPVDHKLKNIKRKKKHGKISGLHPRAEKNVERDRKVVPLKLAQCNQNSKIEIRKQN